MATVLPFDLLGPSLHHLNLTCQSLNTKTNNDNSNGFTTWLRISDGSAALRVSESSLPEPFQPLEVWVETHTGRFCVRAWGVTRKRGKVDDVQGVRKLFCFLYFIL